MTLASHIGRPVSLQRILYTWWPLAASWLLMGIELPALSAIVARLPDPVINLAAYGGVVFPISMIIESPIIMLLAASTALSKDWPSYLLIRRFMMIAGAILTGIHVLIAFTPLYYLIVEGVLGVPQEIVEPARVGLQIMTPWTWSIAYRRFNQGVLIRFGHSRTVGVGTLIRLSVDAVVLGIGYTLGTIPGIVVASTAVASGVISEAVYTGFVIKPVLRNELKPAPAVQPALTWKAFWNFYIPLAMTSLLMLLANPIGSAAISRMPQALASLAAWSVVTGLIFMLRSLGIALNEVVVALLDQPHSYMNLHRFAWILAGVSTGLLLLIVTTRLSTFWFTQVSALSPQLAVLARQGIWLAIPLPALSAFQSWFQGTILHSQRTRGIIESVAIYLITSSIVLIGGVVWGQVAGLYIGLAALTISVGMQTFWLWHRSRPAVEQVRQRDVPALVQTLTE